MEQTGYVRLKEETGDKLVFVREPTSRAWAILIGLVSIGVGAAWYINDYLLWKMAYISGMFFVGVSCFEDWEECEFNKAEERVKITKTSIFQKLMPPKDPKIVTAGLRDVTSVEVEAESVRYGGTGYIVVLKFAGGITLGVTETATMADRSAHEQVAEKIRTFLQLGQVTSSDDDNDRMSADDEEIIAENIGAKADTLSPAPAVAVSVTELAAKATDPVSKEDDPVAMVQESVARGDASVTKDEAPVAKGEEGQVSGSSSSDEGFEKIEESDLLTQDPAVAP